jgi:hypothetical protein
MLSRMNGFSSTRRSPKIFHFVGSNSLSLTLPSYPAARGKRIGDGDDGTLNLAVRARGCRHAGGYCPAWRDSRTRT